MKRIIALVLSLSLLLGASCALADSSINVHGTSQIFKAPDMASISANATVNAPTVTEAQQELSSIIQRVTDGLSALGLKDDDIVTDNYCYYPLYNYDAPAPVLYGYQANHMLTITCRNLEQLDTILGILTDNDISSINGITYDVSDRAQLYREALVMAMEAAREKAGMMAQAEGLTLGKLESVIEASYDPYVVNSLVERTSNSAKDVASGIRAGTVSVSATVTCQFEAK